jgi:hypothetical protein
MEPGLIVPSMRCTQTFSDQARPQSADLTDGEEVSIQPLSNCSSLRMWDLGNAALA